MDIGIFLSIFFIISAGIMIGGFIIYKGWELDSWENGVKKVLTFGFHLIYKIYCFAYTELTGKEISGNCINTALMCSNHEVLELVTCLDGHPYDTPSLESYIPNENGIAWYDISAIGLVHMYRDLTCKQLADMVYKIIQNYFMKTRGVQVFIYILVVTPTRLYFAIALSEEGRKSLEKQALNTTAKPNVENREQEPLTEEIKFPEGSGGKGHDSRLPKDGLH